MTPSRRLVACASCGCYARVSDATCPHCEAPLRQSDGSFAPTKVAIFLGIAVLTTPLAAQTGCSGSADVSGGGDGGAGGDGGSGVTTGSANTTTTSITSTTVSTYATSATTTSSTTTSSSSSGTCDDSGDCGDSTSGCIACAIAGACSDDYDACVADQSCIDYSTCAGSCGDQACADQCVADYPVGADLYTTLTACILCEQCYNDCYGASLGCP